MGIIMMIVVPMIIQSFTLGFVYDNFLGANPTNAIMFAGALLITGAVSMLWIKPSREEDESPEIPLVAHHY